MRFLYKLSENIITELPKQERGAWKFPSFAFEFCLAFLWRFFGVSLAFYSFSIAAAKLFSFLFSIYMFLLVEEVMSVCRSVSRSVGRSVTRTLKPRKMVDYDINPHYRTLQYLVVHSFVHPFIYSFIHRFFRSSIHS